MVVELWMVVFLCLRAGVRVSCMHRRSGSNATLDADDICMREHLPAAQRSQMEDGNEPVLTGGIDRSMISCESGVIVL